MGSIPSILVIVNHRSLFKSLKTTLHVRQFGKRTLVKQAKPVRTKTGPQTKAIPKRPTRSLRPVITRK